MLHPRKVLILVLVAVFLRTIVDSFASGVFFALALKFDSQQTAALVSSFSLLLSFLLAPIVGHLLDRQLLKPHVVAILFVFSGMGMILFILPAVSITTAIFVNIFVINLLGIPSAIYINYLSSIIIKNRPAGGYSLIAAINTTAAIIGSIFGAFLIQDNSQLTSWVWYKIGFTAMSGLFLVLIFTIIQSSVSQLEDEPVPRTAITVTQSPKIILVNLMQQSRRVIRDILQFYRKGPTEISNNRSPVILLGLIMGFLAANRIFFLLLIAFKIFIIFNSDVFLYTVFANSAAILAVVTFPIYGRIADKLSGYRFLLIGILIQPLYFISFLITSNSIILVILWALPLSSILDVSLTGWVAETTKSYERSSALGFVSGMNALGYMTGTWLVSRYVLTTVPSWVIFIPVLTPIVCFLLIMPLNPKTITTANHEVSEVTSE